MSNPNHTSQGSSRNLCFNFRLPFTLPCRFVNLNRLSVASRFWCNFRVNSTILGRPSLFPGLPVTVPGNRLSLAWDYLSPFLGARTVQGGNGSWEGQERSQEGISDEECKDRTISRAPLFAFAHSAYKRNATHNRKATHNRNTTHNRNATHKRNPTHKRNATRKRNATHKRNATPPRISVFNPSQQHQLL